MMVVKYMDYQKDEMIKLRTKMQNSIPRPIVH